jgi:hypothetical protein
MPLSYSEAAKKGKTMMLITLLKTKKMEVTPPVAIATLSQRCNLHEVEFFTTTSIRQEEKVAPHLPTESFTNGTNCNQPRLTLIMTRTYYKLRITTQ